MPNKRCNGRDPAYPGLSCYLDRGHPDDCEFATEEVGIEWRRRAMAAEARVANARRMAGLWRSRAESLQVFVASIPDVPPDVIESLGDSASDWIMIADLLEKAVE
jgi:hypothetical protein